MNTVTKISTELNFTNYTSWFNCDELVTIHGGMLLPAWWDDKIGVRFKNKGDIYLQFDCHMRSRYKINKIETFGSDSIEYIDIYKKNIYKVRKFDLFLFLSSLISREPCTICVSTNEGYVQWFSKPIEDEINKWIEQNILNKL